MTEFKMDAGLDAVSSKPVETCVRAAAGGG